MKKKEMSKKTKMNDKKIGTAKEEKKMAKKGDYKGNMTKKSKKAI